MLVILAQPHRLCLEKTLGRRYAEPSLGKTLCQKANFEWGQNLPFGRNKAGKKYFSLHYAGF